MNGILVVPQLRKLEKDGAAGLLIYAALLRSVSLLRGNGQSTTRLPVMKLMSRTTRATTNSRCISDPATWNPHPSNHRIRRIAKIVQSIHSTLSRGTHTY